MLACILFGTERARRDLQHSTLSKVLHLLLPKGNLDLCRLTFIFVPALSLMDTILRLGMF